MGAFVSLLLSSGSRQGYILLGINKFCESGSKMYIERGDWQYHSAHAWVGDTDPGHILVLWEPSLLAVSLSSKLGSPSDPQSIRGVPRKLAHLDVFSSVEKSH